MTTCDSLWIVVAMVTPFAGVLGGAILYSARRARLAPASARPWLGIVGGVALLCGAALLWLSWGAGLLSLIGLAFLPALLGATYALASPDASRTKAAFFAACVTCAVLAALVVSLAWNAATSPPCPGTEIGP